MCGFVIPRPDRGIQIFVYWIPVCTGMTGRDPSLALGLDHHDKFLILVP